MRACYSGPMLCDYYLHLTCKCNEGSLLTDRLITLTFHFRNVEFRFADNVKNGKYGHDYKHDRSTTLSIQSGACRAILAGERGVTVITRIELTPSVGFVALQPTQSN